MDADVAESRLSGQPCLGPELGCILGKRPSLGASSSEAVNKDKVKKRLGRAAEEVEPEISMGIETRLGTGSPACQETVKEVRAAVSLLVLDRAWVQLREFKLVISKQGWL